MAVSVFDLFRVGIGPSSSHTVGPMRAAGSFVGQLRAAGALAAVRSIRVELFGSLAATGRGHGTFGAVLLGLEGCDPERLLPEEAARISARIVASGGVRPGAEGSGSSGPSPATPRTGDEAGRGESTGTVPRIVPIREQDFVLRPLTVLPRHPNALRLSAYTEAECAGDPLAAETYYSVGGGFILRDGAEEEVRERIEGAISDLPFPFATGAELLAHTRSTGLSIAQVMLANETALADEGEVLARLCRIWEVMEACKDAALARSGPLPGGLDVRRRAPDWHRRLRERDPDRDPQFWQEWINLVALAVNEENASGGRVVTAPTNGAAGIIPAVLFYATHYAPGATAWSVREREQVITDFLLTAGAIGVLYKEQASISGAEVGCQGEVGSASSMAAAGLAQVLGGTPEQVENAAEIAMEHNLGLTCDPIGGLVQIPCIERNAIAAAKAVNAARMALMGDGEHRVSLDQVIATMRETGRDMSDKYKETSTGGLAVSVVEC